MARLLYTFVTALLVLPVAATAALWARSHLAHDQLRVGTLRARYWQVNTYAGGVACTVANGWYEDQPWDRQVATSRFPYPRTLRGARTHLQRFSDDTPAVRWAPVTQDRYGPLMIERGTWGPAGITPTFPYVTYDLRYWALAAAGSLPLLAAMGLAARRARRRRRWVRAGRCAGCGYDLTGNQTGVCPECGTPSHFAGRARPD